jgi:hypothetical protein
MPQNQDLNHSNQLVASNFSHVGVTPGPMLSNPKRAPSHKTFCLLSFHNPSRGATPSLWGCWDVLLDSGDPLAPQNPRSSAQIIKLGPRQGELVGKKFNFLEPTDPDCYDLLLKGGVGRFQPGPRY